MGLFGDDNSRDDYLRLEARVTALEAAVVQLAAAGAAPLPGQTASAPAALAYPWLPDVLALIKSGRKIEAIKVVREHTNWDLRVAKEFVDGL